MAATTTLEPTSDAAATSVLGRIWALPLAAHAAVLFVTLTVVLVAFMHPTSAYTFDEGAYALTAEALQEGRWEYDYRLSAYDPEESHFPIVLSTRTDNGWFSYPKHPLWHVLLATSGSLFGNAFGFHLLPLLGAVGAACAAWLLAGLFDRRAARPAFWLLAAGPVLAHGFIIWAHAPFAATSGFALVLGLRVARGGAGPIPLLGCGALLALGVFLRSDGVLFAFATGVVITIQVWRRTGLRAGVLTLVDLGLPSAVALYIDRAWTASVLGTSAGIPGAPPPIPGTSSASSPSALSTYLSGRSSGATNTLLGGAYSNGAASLLLPMAAMVVPLLAVLALRRGGPRRDVIVGLGAAAVLLIVRVLVASDVPITGLLPAWPLVLAGLVVAGRWLWRGPGQSLTAIVVIVLLGVLATQYSVGGGLDWGGRFLASTYVPLATLAAVGVQRRWDRWSPGLRGALVPAIVVLGASSVLVCLVAVASIRGRHEDLLRDVEAADSSIAVSTVTAVPQLAWRTHSDIGWLLVDQGELDLVTTRLAEGGEQQITVVSYSEPAGAGFAQVREAGDGVWILSR